MKALVNNLTDLIDILLEDNRILPKTIKCSNEFFEKLPERDQSVLITGAVRNFYGMNVEIVNDFSDWTEEEKENQYKIIR